MKVHKIKDSLSLVPIRVGACFNKTDLGIGTAFLYAVHGKRYLVTNWHNVSGRNPRTLQPLAAHGGIPNVMKLAMARTTRDGKGRVAIRWKVTSVPLYADKGNEEPRWFEHSVFGRRVDLAAIELDDRNDEQLLHKTANSEELDLSALKLRPGMDVFVLGFPRGMTGGAQLPVWKRASLASEPDFDIDGVPMMYVDTATKEGMSGAPVYAQETGWWMPERAEGMKDSVIGRGQRFLGIYSGRVGDSTFEAQLGIVWKEQAIQEVINARHIGTSSFSINE